MVELQFTARMRRLLKPVALVRLLVAGCSAEYAPTHDYTKYAPGCVTGFNVRTIENL
jgi:hypothetical protein